MPARSTRWPPACWWSASATPHVCSTTSSTTTKPTWPPSDSASAPPRTTPTANCCRGRELSPNSPHDRPLKTPSPIISPGASSRCRTPIQPSKSTASAPMIWPEKARTWNSKPVRSTSRNSAFRQCATAMPRPHARDHLLPMPSKSPRRNPGMPKPTGKTNRTCSQSWNSTWP